MILEFGFENYRMFKKKNVISFKADKRTKYLSSNIEDLNNVGVLKSLAIYGPNNSGKSNITTLLNIFKNVLLGNNDFECNRDIFHDSPISKFKIIFNDDAIDNAWIEYEFFFNSVTKQFIKESLNKVTYYKGGFVFKSVIFEKDIENKKLKIFDSDNSQYLSILPSDKPFLFTISYDGEFKDLLEWKNALIKCSNNIVILKMFDIPLEKTIEMLKSQDENKIKFINSFVKSADLSITEFKYDEDSDLNEFSKVAEEKVLDRYKNSTDTHKLSTRYGDATVPSYLYDSAGTKKIEAFASYIYECISEGKLLVVDELDNGIHFTLTRAIVSAFNNMLNKKGQILFTAHDLLLIDCNYLLRKDQIYFLSRNQDSTSIVSLKSLTTRETGLREGESLLRRYNHGDFGYVPRPDFTKALYDLLAKR